MKSFLLITAIIFGIATPQAAAGVFLIKYFLMAMLFFSFLNIEINRKSFPKNIVLILIANIGLALVLYYLLNIYNHQLALTAFIVAITPTATAAPAVCGFLKQKISYAISSVLLTNIVIAFIIPFLLPKLTQVTDEISTLSILLSVAQVILIPLILAQIIANIFPKLKKKIIAYQKISFYLWVVVIVLASSKVSNYLLNTEIELSQIIYIASIALIICVINFGLGYILGGNEYKHEASQSLGQKNTMFTFWLSFTFLSPLIALGPMFYLIYHNIYNSIQLYRINK